MNCQAVEGDPPGGTNPVFTVLVIFGVLKYLLCDRDVCMLGCEFLMFL